MAATFVQTKTAINIANPSIQAKWRCSSSAVDTSITILAIDAINKTRIVKSSNAFHNNSQYVYGGLTILLL